jgi:hypothetical protein
LGGILGSVGHRGKIHKITPVTGKEQGDLEIKDYVVLQKTKEQDDRLLPPRTLILDFIDSMRYGRSHVHKRWLGKRFFIIPNLDNCTLITQNRSSFYQSQLTRQATSTTTLSVYYSCMLTVKHRLWLTKYQRNRINFVFFLFPAMLILRCQWG